jgi:hypothetical protein
MHLLLLRGYITHRDVFVHTVIWRLVTGDAGPTAGCKLELGGSFAAGVMPRPHAN